MSIRSTRRLQDHVAVIAGAARGIGQVGGQADGGDAHG